MNPGKIVKWSAMALMLAGTGGASWRWGPRLYSRWSGQAETAAKTQQAQYVRARRADLRITVTEDGKLRAIKNNLVYSQLRGQNRITWLAPEGSTVKKGEKLVEFDKKQLEETLRTKSGELEQAKRSMVVAEEALKIQVSTSKAAVATAESKLGDAEVALRVYQDLEGPKKLSEMLSQLNEARNKLAAAQKTQAEAQKKIDDNLFFEEEQRKGLDRELENAKEQCGAIRKTIETTQLQQKIFRRYDYPQNLHTKKEAVSNAKLEVEKAKVSASSEVHQKEEEVNKVKDTIARLERETADLKDEIAKCTLTAPADGMVLYGDPGQRQYYYNGETQIRVGMDWYGSNTIITIPDLSAFEVSLQIGEEYRGKLAPGCKVTVTMEAVPGLRLDGELKSISSLAQSRQYWDSSSPKVFDSVVSVGKTDPRMVSGMTARAEIEAETLKNVLAVPLEAVINEEGKAVVYVRKGDGSDRRLVKTGKNNDHLVEILEGVSEGEWVDVTPGHGGKAEKSL